MDFEGNCVADVEQLHYLKRLPKLEDVNLKYNPVQADPAYYELMKDSSECLVTLDDEPVSNDFWSAKLQSVVQPTVEQTDFTQNLLFKKFISMGLDQFDLLETCESEISKLAREEPPDE